jgi:hypothetical protein
MSTNHIYKATRRKLSTEVRRPGLGAILQKYGTSHNKFGRSRSATTPTISNKTQGSVTRYQSTSNPLSMPSGRENGFPNSPLNTNIASPFSSSADAAATSFRLHPRQSMPTARSIMNVHRAQSTEVAVARRGLLARYVLVTNRHHTRVLCMLSFPVPRSRRVKDMWLLRIDQTASDRKPRLRRTPLPPRYLDNLARRRVLLRQPVSEDHAQTVW